jgi:hypothetical protein
MRKTWEGGKEKVGRREGKGGKAGRKTWEGGKEKVTEDLFHKIKGGFFKALHTCH